MILRFVIKSYNPTTDKVEVTKGYAEGESVWKVTKRVVDAYGDENFESIELLSIEGSEEGIILMEDIVE